jgi:proteasome assembly chaperone (PAC2) family protein
MERERDKETPNGQVPAIAGLVLFAAATMCIPAVALLGAAHGFMAGWAQTWRPRER